MLNVQNVAFLPLILGLVQLALQVGMPKKFSPLLAVALGVAAGIFYITPGDYTTGVLVGLSLGLGATGLYSSVKNVSEGVQGIGVSPIVLRAPDGTPAITLDKNRVTVHNAVAQRLQVPTTPAAAPAPSTAPSAPAAQTAAEVPANATAQQ